jgi:glycosyltransferase involved in cell wall biosynthesis
MDMQRMNVRLNSIPQSEPPLITPDKPRIAFVQDALPFKGGAERVLAQALRAFPNTPIYTLVYNPENFHGSPIRETKILTSFINALPGAQRNHRIYFPLYPIAVESLDLSAYDLVISFSYAASHGVITRPDQRHIAYYYTPMRKAYREFQEATSKQSLSSRMLYHLLQPFRSWDLQAARRPDQIYAVSHWAAKRIWNVYRRSAQVIYPPVEIERFQSSYPRENYYLCVSRMEAHKRLDLLIQAFNQSKRPLVLAGEGRDKNRLKSMAGSNVHFLDKQSDPEVARLLGKARAFVHAAAEDFGIAMVESQAAGCPVIAFQLGGASEIVIHERTGILFPEQTSESLNAAISVFETNEKWISPAELQSSAKRFSAEQFRQKFAAIIHASGKPLSHSASQAEHSGNPTELRTVPND